MQKEGSKLIRKIFKNVLPDYRKWVIQKIRKQNQNVWRKNQLLLKMWKKTKNENIEVVALENEIDNKTQHVLFVILKNPITNSKPITNKIAKNKMSEVWAW